MDDREGPPDSRPEDRFALPDVPPEDVPELNVPESTAYLGRFELFESEIVIELLRGAGIFAMPKQELTDNEHFAYSPILESDRGIVMVDASKVAEARAVIDTDLPRHLEEIARAMDDIDVGDEDDSMQDGDATPEEDTPLDGE